MPTYPAIPVNVVDGNGNIIIPISSSLAALPLAIQVHDPSGGPYAMCSYLSGGAPIKSTDYAIIFPGGFTNGSPLDYFTQLTNIHRAPTWFNWLTADNFVAGTNGITTTAFSAEPASLPSPSTQPYTTLTGGYTTGDISLWNPEPAHTAAAEISAMAATMTQALTDGLANSPTFDVWWVPLSSLYNSQMASVGPLVGNVIYQAQNVPAASFVSTVQAAIALANSVSPSPKVWVQVNATPTSGALGNLNALAAASSLPHGIVLLTEPSSTSSYLTDLQNLVNALRP